MDPAEEFLAHYGKRGMKWGVRNSSRSSSGGAPKPPKSHDATNVEASLAKMKAGGTKSLSNKELQDVVTRMNLEQQYSRLRPKGPGEKLVRFGAKFAGDVLVGVAKQQAIKVVGGAVTKQLGDVLQAPKGPKSPKEWNTSSGLKVTEVPNGLLYTPGGG
jgi:hypothetical protein